MKSKLQKIIILTLSICMTLGLMFTPEATPVSLAASSKTVAAMKAYNAMLSKSTIKWYDVSFKTSALDFACVDVNKDGYPELIVYNNNACEAEAPLRIYTYYNKKVRLLLEGSYTNEIDIYQSGKVFAYETGVGGYELTEFYSISKGKAILKAKYENNDGKKYWIGKTKVSKSKYKAYIKKIKNGSKKSYKLVKNTQANRNSIIGKYLPITISRTSASLVKGTSLSLSLSNTNKKANWKTNNSSVASVSSTGKVKANKKGTATITATLAGKKYTCKVTVKNTYTAKVSNVKLTDAPSSYYKQLEGDGAVAMLTFTKPIQFTGFQVDWYFKESGSSWYYCGRNVTTGAKYYFECGSDFSDNDQVKTIITPYFKINGVNYYGTSVTVIKKLGKLF